MTKADTAAPADVAALEARLRALNPVAPVRRVAFGAIAPDDLLRGRTRDVPAARRSRTREEAGHDHARHDGDVRAFTLVLDEPLDWDAFAVWLTMLLHSRGLDVLRVKGLLDVGAAGPVVLDGVQHVVHRPRHLDAWPDDDRRSRIVFITRGIEREAVLASLEAFAALGRGAVSAAQRRLQHAARDRRRGRAARPGADEHHADGVARLLRRREGDEPRVGVLGVGRPAGRRPQLRRAGLARDLDARRSVPPCRSRPGRRRSSSSAPAPRPSQGPRGGG